MTVNSNLSCLPTAPNMIGPLATDNPTGLRPRSERPEASPEASPDPSEDQVRHVGNDRIDGAQGVGGIGRARPGGAECHHDAVAQEFVDRPAIGLYDRDHPVLVVRQNRHDFRRIGLCRHAGKATNIDVQDRCITDFALSRPDLVVGVADVLCDRLVEKTGQVPCCALLGYRP